MSQKVVGNGSRGPRPRRSSTRGATETAIRLEGEERTYPGPDGSAVTALRVARWEVAAGAHVALVGDSGSGKSTLLSVLAGLAVPDRGRVEVLGADLGSMTEAARDRFRGQRIGLVFQSLNLFPSLTARENLLAAALFAGRASREDGERADALLERVGLDRRARHRPGMLSLGEQQRVAVARAVMNRPSLLLCDEPTGSLDASRRDEVIALLRRVAEEEKATLVVVTHDAAVVADLPASVAIRDLAA